MKAARRSRPRNPLATVALLAKGGAHPRKDKKASRARQNALVKRRLREEGEA